MQKQFDLFGKAMPAWMENKDRHRDAYGLQITCIGQIMAGQAGRKSDVDYDLSNNSDPIINPEDAKAAIGLVAMVYHGINNLDLSPQVQVPHEMLLGMNPSQIFQLYAGTWLLKMDRRRWDGAVDKHKFFWQVASAARTVVSENPMNSYLLRRLDDLCGKTYIADDDGSMPARLRQLSQSVADQFMRVVTSPFRSPKTAGYAPVSGLTVGLDQAVFGHFARKFAEGEAQLSLARTYSNIIDIKTTRFK